MIDNPLSDMHDRDLQKLSRASRLFRDAANWRAAEGVRQRRGEGPGIEFRELRPYSPGDDVRHIDWRASTRRDLTYLRTYENELTGKWYICLDCSGSMGRPDPRRFRLAVQLAAAFGYLLLDAGNSVGLVAFNHGIEDYCPPGTGRRQYARLAARLSRLSVQATSGGSSLAATAPRLRNSCHLVIISDFLAPDGMIRDLRALRTRGRQVRAVQIGSDLDLVDPGSGTIDLMDVESGERLTVSALARSTASTELARVNRQLLDYCTTTGIVLTACTSTSAWLTTALKHGGVHLA